MIVRRESAITDYHCPDKGANYQHLTASMHVGLGLFLYAKENKPLDAIFLLGTIS